jgi:hypothetical protein
MSEKQSVGMQPEVARRLCARCPEAAALPEVQRLLNAQVGGVQRHPKLPKDEPEKLPMPCHASESGMACRAWALARMACGVASAPPTPTPPHPQGSATAAEHLEALQRLLLLPSCTAPAAGLFRPLLLRATTQLVAAAAAGGQQAPPGADLAVALPSLLELAPHLDRWAPGRGRVAAGQPAAGHARPPTGDRVRWPRRASVRCAPSPPPAQGCAAAF